MTAENFDSVLKALSLTRPFKAFTIELEDGRRFEIDHPMAVRDGVAGYLSAKGVPTMFYHDEVKRIIAEPVSAEAQ